MDAKVVVCEVCGCEFTTQVHNRKYCSQSCQEEAGKQQCLEWYLSHQHAARKTKARQTTYDSRICRRCKTKFQPEYGRQYLCDKCMTERSPTWRNKLKFLVPKEHTVPSNLSSQARPPVSKRKPAPKKLIPKEDGRFYCSRMRLTANELPCGTHEICFGFTPCEYLPAGAERPKGVPI